MKYFIRTIAGVFSFLMFTGVSAQVEKLNDGVLIHLAGANVKAIKLEVVSDRIIHVIKSPVDPIHKDTSLMVIIGNKGWTMYPPLSALGEKTEWSIDTKNNETTLTTAVLKVIVDLSTGRIKFHDLKDQILLEEEKNARLPDGQGSSFNPTTIDAGPSWQIKQTFLSTKDEAFYGLGQHQQGIMNYKGEFIELLQNNTEVAIPFLVSNNHCGILWENYSITQFGDGRKYQPLSELKVYDEAGKAGGLTAKYISKKDSSKIFITRTEADISYDFLSSQSKFPSEFPLGDGKVTWQGSVAPAVSGVYKFSVRYGGYMKVWINGKLQLDAWRQSWNPATNILPVNLQYGKKYPIKIEWIPEGGESYVSVNWLEPATSYNKTHFEISSEAADNVNYYFVYGTTMDEIISGYRYLTGKAPIVPKWALGFWQSRERYRTQNEILSTVKTFREKNIPLDNIVMDWQYWKPDEWGSQEFDPSRFSDPKGMIDTLHHMYHAHFMISVWPKFYSGIKNYDLMNSKGFLLTKNIQDNRKDWLGYVSTFYDAFNPAAGKFFWQLVKENLYSKGIDAWWMDAPEPDIHSNLSIEKRKDLMFPNALGSATKYFNAYPLANAKTIYEGQRAADPNKRVFILTRSAYGGLQHYGAAVWSGDIGSRWLDMKNQVSAGVNISMSGLPYWTMDIGGFAVENRYSNLPAGRQGAEGEVLNEWKELMTRWYQFGAFCPLFRSHGQYPYREIFNTAEPGDTAYQSILFYDKLRYRLLPYIYSIAAKAYYDDYTIMRGLIMDFPNDKNASGINDEYLFGPSFLISPVYNYHQRTRKVYLPNGRGWYDLYNGKFFNGGQRVTTDAPYDRMPVFVKEGSIIPMGPALHYSSEKPADTITLFIYTGNNASFNLYEDEDTNYNYEKGMFGMIQIDYNEQERTLMIHDRKGEFPGMLKERVFNIIWITRDKMKTFEPDQRPDEQVIYGGKRLVLKMK
jgi:alpha-D-xyloside xylohydrolase